MQINNIIISGGLISLRSFSAQSETPSMDAPAMGIKMCSIFSLDSAFWTVSIINYMLNNMLNFSNYKMSGMEATEANWKRKKWPESRESAAPPRSA